MGREQNYVNQAWTWFHFSPYAWNVKSVKDNLPHFSWFWVINLTISALIHVQLLKLCELDVNGNSQHRTKPKRDSLKCWKLFSILNFLFYVNCSNPVFEKDCLYLGHCIAKITSQIIVYQSSQPCKDKINIFWQSISDLYLNQNLLYPFFR